MEKILFAFLELIILYICVCYFPKGPHNNIEYVVLSLPIREYTNISNCISVWRDLTLQL